MIEDELGGSIRILNHLVVPQANHDPALALQDSGALLVISRGCLRMLATIDLDGQLRLAASEVDMYESITR